MNILDWYTYIKLQAECGFEIRKDSEHKIYFPNWQLGSFRSQEKRHNLCHAVESISSSLFLFADSVLPGNFSRFKKCIFYWKTWRRRKMFPFGDAPMTSPSLVSFLNGAKKSIFPTGCVGNIRAINRPGVFNNLSESPFPTDSRIRGASRIPSPFQEYTHDFLPSRFSDVSASNTADGKINPARRLKVKRNVCRLGDTSGFSLDGFKLSAH
jgi:hypothetical protein